MEFTEYVLRHAPWSFSKFGSIEKCQLQYYNQYVARKSAQGSSAESKVGVAVHYVSEQVVKHDVAPTDAMLADAVKQGKLTTNEVGAMMSFIPKVESFADWLRNFVHQHKVTETLVEYKMGINRYGEAVPFAPSVPWTEEELLVPWEPTNRDPERPEGRPLAGKELMDAVFNGTAPVVRGVLDLGLLTGNNDLIVLDHKTGKHKNIADHGPQLNIYRLFAAAHYNVRSVQCVIHYVESGRFDWTPPMSREAIIRQLRPWLQVYLNKQHYKLKLIDESAAPPPAEIGWWCSWCGYVRDCAPGLEEATRRANDRKKKGKAPSGVSI